METLVISAVYCIIQKHLKSGDTIQPGASLSCVCLNCESKTYIIERLMPREIILSSSSTVEEERELEADIIKLG